MVFSLQVRLGLNFAQSHLEACSVFAVLHGKKGIRLKAHSSPTIPGYKMVKVQIQENSTLYLGKTPNIKHLKFPSLLTTSIDTLGQLDHLGHRPTASARVSRAESSLAARS